MAEEHGCAGLPNFPGILASPGQGTSYLPCISASTGQATSLPGMAAPRPSFAPGELPMSLRPQGIALGGGGRCILFCESSRRSDCPRRSSSLPRDGALREPAEHGRQRVVRSGGTVFASVNERGEPWVRGRPSWAMLGLL